MSENISIAKKIYRRILRITPMKPALYLIYFRGYKKFLNLKNPKYFGEKIQWLKLYGELEVLSPYVDKYKVRDYIKRVIGEEYLNELYGVYNSPEEIDFNNLPNRFVIKCTNGSGTVIVCDDKNNFNIEKSVHQMKLWLKDQYHTEKKELQYKNIENRIIVEKYLEDTSGSLTDYKFYCFDGKVKYYAVFYDRFTNKSIDVYSVEKGKLKNVKVCDIKNSNDLKVDKKSIDKMISFSEQLSKKFSFVRVDFYCIDGHPIFGELTFTDGAGSDPWAPLEFDIEIANQIELKKILKEEIETRES